MSVTLANGGDQGKRKFSDAYQTPWECTVALMDWLDIDHDVQIWEPACGEGKIVEALQALGYKTVIASDILPPSVAMRGWLKAEQQDFLQGPSRVTSASWVITNPPFSLSAKFIEHTFKTVYPYGFAFLLKSQYWHATTRLQLFRQCPPDAVLPLTWRPDFHFGTQGGAPTMEVYWTVWRRPFNPPGKKNTIYDLLQRPTAERMRKLGLGPLRTVRKGENHGGL